MRIFIFVLSVLFAQLSYSVESSSLDTVTVQGRGFVDIEPDIVDVSFNLYATKKTLPKAKEAVDELYKQALIVIKQFEIQKKDIKLTFINSRPDYEWIDRKRIFKGHRVSRSLKLIIRELDSYPELLEALVNVGLSEINRVSARISDNDQFKRLALKKATIVAKDKAKFLAKEFGRQLDKVLVINETGVHVPRPIIHYRTKTEKTTALSAPVADSAPPAANFGTQRISASVSAVFALK